ncbi:Serine/threonine-protein kinase BLUS1 [Striga hermonthica]|uniref:Serine/threonine-protein kinase BLUS1 n=1 Tax=Striga hermonthica TaxID=68872 RepID=A0A9N7MKM9_STRHE|nr:Serine/threonine-protein kinase BLUS1 [Striga hermonthica]
MAHLEKQETYPLDPNSYKILDEIGRGTSATVYKAICIPMNSSTVAIKAIDLEKSRADLENVRREAKTLSLLNHPNILRAHCSFAAGTSLWVVMPFMSCGSLQSIMSSSFPTGLPEPPSADKLLRHPFFKGNVRGPDYLVRNVLQGLPPVERRFKGAKIDDRRLRSLEKMECDDDEDIGDETITRKRRISGWNFDEEGFKLEPVFPPDHDKGNVEKQVSPGDEAVIQEKEGSEAGRSEGSSSACSVADWGGGVEGEVLEGLLFLRRSLDLQRQQVEKMIALVSGEENGETSSEDQMAQAVEKLKMDLQAERKKRADLEMELEYLKLQQRSSEYIS